MSINQDGFPINLWVIKQTHNHLSEGAVVGIVFGWMVPIIGLYILGIFIICKCLKNRKKEEKSSKDKGSQGERRSESQNQSQNISKREPRSNYSVSDDSKREVNGTGNRMRKIYEDNPTLQMMDIGPETKLKRDEQFRPQFRQAQD